MNNYGNTKEWEWYENGKNYNKRLEPSFYDRVDCNWDFFYGDQWRNAGLSEDLPQPVFNNINRFVTFFVASIMANKTAVHFASPIPMEDDDMSDDVVNQSWTEFEERVKLVWQTKNALYDGAVTGDYVGHLWLNPNKKVYDGKYGDVDGLIEFDLVDPNNFYVSNPNSRDIQSMNYIQIVGRDTIKNLQEEANEQDEIQSDKDTEEQASKYGRIEMESGGKETEKALYIITYCKKKAKGSEKKTVHVTKSTKGAYIYKDIDLGITMYPVAHGNWELQRNTYHGMSFVTGMIPTQIFINRAFAMAMYNTMTTAFPKLLFDKTKIGGFTSAVGGQLGVELTPGQSLSNIAQYMAPGNMSAQVIQMIELAQTYMQEAVGASDALLGNVNPEQASGAAISVASKQAGIPLENPRANMYNWLEDIGRIYLDMVTNMYGTRPVIMPTEDGAELQEFDFETLKDKYKTVRIEVGPTTYWSALAAKDTMDNLLANGYIQFLDYLEGMTDEFIPQRQQLIDKIKEQVETQNEPVSEEEFVASLTPEEQAQWQAMSPEQRTQVLEQQGVV